MKKIADQCNPHDNTSSVTPSSQSQHSPSPQKSPPAEIGGPKGLEPTRYGDWERNGICRDF